MNASDQDRLSQATDRAIRWHADQCRKQTSIPYVSHLIQVAGLVLEHGGNTDQAIAGLLHDSLEDAPDPAERARREEEIAEAFGPGVLRMVLDCTDTLPDESLEKKRSWEERKKAYIAHLDEASKASLLVAACDKRHNLAAIVGDVISDGPEVFDRFTATPDQHVWYFESILAAIREEIPRRLIAEIEDLLEKLRQLASGVEG